MASNTRVCTEHIQAQTKKANQRLHHLAFSAILKSFHSGAIESSLTQNIMAWFGNSYDQNRKALHRVIWAAEQCCRSALPFLQDNFNRRCRSRAVNIFKDSSHPANRLLQLLKSGKTLRSIMAKTERKRRSFYPSAGRLLNEDMPLLTPLHNQGTLAL